MSTGNITRHAPSDLAPGRPTDCALSRYIRAHIITKQLAESLADQEITQARIGRLELARRNAGDCTLLMPQAE